MTTPETARIAPTATLSARCLRGVVAGLVAGAVAFLVGGLLFPGMVRSHESMAGGLATPGGASLLATGSPSTIFGLSSVLVGSLLAAIVGVYVAASYVMQGRVGAVTAAPRSSVTTAALRVLRDSAVGGAPPSCAGLSEQELRQDVAA